MHLFLKLCIYFLNLCIYVKTFNYFQLILCMYTHFMHNFMHRCTVGAVSIFWSSTPHRWPPYKQFLPDDAQTDFFSIERILRSFT